MQHYGSPPPGWLYQGPPPSPRRRTLSQLSTTSTVTQSRRTQPRPPPLSPSSTSSSRFTSPPPRSPTRVPLPASPATLVHTNKTSIPSSSRPQHTKGRSSVSDDKIPLGLLQAKAGKSKRVRWSAETASGGTCKKSLFRRVSGLGESSAERDARQAELAQRRKAVNGKQADAWRGGYSAAGSSGSFISSFSSHCPYPPPSLLHGFTAPGYAPLPFNMQPLPPFLGAAGPMFHPRPVPMPPAFNAAAPRSHSPSPPSSPLSDVESLYENQLRRAPPFPSTLGAPNRPRQPLAEVSNSATPAIRSPLPGYTTILPPSPHSRPQPRRPATPPQRLQPIRCDSNSTTEGPSTASSGFTDEDDYEDTEGSHAWFSNSSGPPSKAFSPAASARRFAEGPSSFGPSSSPPSSQRSQSGQSSQGDVKRDSPDDLKLESPSWERELIEEYSKWADGERD